MTESHESLANVALDATKRLHEMLRLVSLTSPIANDDILQMKALNKASNHAVNAMRRHYTSEAQAASVRQSLLREAIHGELLDRQARGARLEERYQALSDTRNFDSAIDAAKRATSSLDQGISLLCSHHHAATSGTHQAEQMAKAAAAEEVAAGRPM